MDKQNATVTVLDGAIGTQLLQRGMPTGVCPELWALENPEQIRLLFQRYINAGAQEITTPTFGANRCKLKGYHLETRCAELNETLASLTRQAAPESVRIGGNIGPTGLLMYPMGELDFDEAVDIFREQAVALMHGGVDFFAIETMMDIQEARAAVIGCKEACDLPISVTMTFENGRTLMGTAPDVAIITLQALGVWSAGCNCGAGPVEMLPDIQKMAKYAQIPIVAKPNAGKPLLQNGKTVFNMSSTEFATECLSLAQAGARRVGGCCGTGPEHIEAFHKTIEDMRFLRFADQKDVPHLTSLRTALTFEGGVMIGNIRIQSDADTLRSLQNEDYNFLLDITEDMDAQIYCLTAVSDQFDETKTLLGAMEALLQYDPTPLAFRPSSTQVLQSVLRRYPGRALIVSDLIPESEHEQSISICSQYGALLVS